MERAQISSLGRMIARSSVGVETADPTRLDPKAEPGELNDGTGEDIGARVSLLGGTGGATPSALA